MKNLICVLLLLPVWAQAQTLAERPTSVTYYVNTSGELHSQGPLTLNSRELRRYDERGRLAETRLEVPRYGGVTGSFEVWAITQYSYLPTDSLQQMELLKWDDSGLAYRLRIRYSRNSTGRPEQKQQEFWDSVAGKWQPTQRSRYEYDERGRLVTERFFLDMSQGDSLRLESVTTYQYRDDTTRIMSTVGQGQVIVRDSQQRVRRIDNLYDNTRLGNYTEFSYFADRQEKLTHQFSERTKQIEPSSKEVTYYNPTGQPLRRESEFLTGNPGFDYFGYTHSITTYRYEHGQLIETVLEELNPKKNLAKLSIRVEYRYGEVFPNQPELVLYPNPTNGLINVLNADAVRCVNLVEVFDEHGRLEQQFHSETNAQDPITFRCLSLVDLSPLASGYYLIRLTTGDGATVIKRIQKR